MSGIKLGNKVRIMRQYIVACQKNIETAHQKVVELNKKLDEYDSEIEARNEIKNIIFKKNIKIPDDISLKLETEILDFSKKKNEIQNQVSRALNEEEFLKGRYQPMIDAVRGEIERLEKTNLYLDI